MHLAVQTFTLRIPGADSLKAKRSVVKSIKERIRSRFNAAVIESDHQDQHQLAEIAVAVLADGRAAVDSMLDSIDSMVESDGRALIQNTRREFR